MAVRGARHIAVWVFLLSVCLAAFAAGPAQPAARPDAVSPWTAVTDIKVVPVSGGIQVHIIGDGPLRAHGRRWYDPERFVVDIQGAVFAGDNHTINIGTADITSVRIIPLFEQDGRATRVIISLEAPRDVELLSSGGTLIVNLAAQSSDVAHAPSRVLSPVDQDVLAPPTKAPEARTLIAQRGSAGEAATEPPSAGGPAPAPFRAEQQLAPQPSAIAADNNNPPPSTVEIASEKPADVQLFDNASPDLGVGITGTAEDATLGLDPEHILGPAKQAKKRKPPKAVGEGSMPAPFRLSGAATGGYYQADSKSTYDAHEVSPVGSMRLDFSGYLYHPGLVTFSVKPQGSVGRQSSEGIFPDGRGVSASTTILGGGTTPLTLSYSRLNHSLVTFGPLDRLAGLEANTSQDSVSANWTLRLKRMPEMKFNFAKFSDSYEPLANLAPKTTNSSRLGSVEMHEKVMGWNLETRYKLERSSQDLINIFDPSQAPYLYKRKDQEARFSADHDFGQRLSLSFTGGATKSQNSVQDRPFDQSYRFLTTNAMAHLTKKLTFGFHAGVTNNVSGATLERATSPTVTPADQPLLLVPASARLQLVHYSVSAQYALRKDLQLNAEALRETTTPQQATAIAAPQTALASVQAGISWSRRLRFVRFQSHYAANIGNFLYGSAGSSRTSGHRADLGATVGSLHSLELTAGVQGSMEDVTGNTFMRDRNWGANLSLSHTFHDAWKLQATYNRARDNYNFLNQQYSSDGNGFSLVLSNPRLDFTASHNIRDGLTFQADPRLQYLSSSQAGMLLAAFPGMLMTPSTADWSSASIGIHPFGKFRARGTWLRSRQHMQGAANNQYMEWEASAGYQFRNLSFDAGYIFHDQDFGVDIFQRNRLFFRVVREFTVF